jgi:peptidoglycan DL-endopeptidase CwlO
MGRHRLEVPPPQHRAGSRRIGQLGVGAVVATSLLVAFWASGQGRDMVTEPATPAVSTAVPTADPTATPSMPAPVEDESAELQRRIVDGARVYVERRSPYVEGGKSPKKGFDSSGLVWQVLKDVGREEPYRTTTALKKWAEPIEFADLQPGDLVFYAHHVGVFVGDGQMVDASPMADTVIEHEVWQDPYPTFGRVPD